MIEAALILAIFLHRPPIFVEAVFEESGIDGVAVVEMESQFNPHAFNWEPRGFNSYGLFQIDSEWHNQYRNDLAGHIEEGSIILAECKAKAPGDVARAVAIYNGGDNPGAKAREWGAKVKRERDALSQYLFLRLTQ